MKFKCVYLRNNFCMFYASPTCPYNKKCVDAIARENEEERYRRLLNIKAKDTTESYDSVGYPRPPALDKLEGGYSYELVKNHYRICEMYLRRGNSPLLIAKELGLTEPNSVTMVLHYVREYVLKMR